MQVAAAGGNRVHGCHDLRVRCLLEHVTHRPGGKRLPHVARIVLHREHEHLGFWGFH